MSHHRPLFLRIALQRIASLGFALCPPSTPLRILSLIVLISGPVLCAAQPVWADDPVRGMCVDANDRAIDGVRVLIYEASRFSHVDPVMIAETSTDEDGRFEFASIEQLEERMQNQNRPTMVIAIKPGHASQIAYLLETGNGFGAQVIRNPIRVNLKLPPARTMSGTVRDVNDEPISTVVLNHGGLIDEENDVFVRATKSVMGGHYVINDLDPNDGPRTFEMDERTTATIYPFVSVTHDDYSPIRLMFEVSPDIEPLPTRKDFRLEPAAVVHGRVISVAGLPVAGVEVQAQGHTEGWSTAITNDDGEYSLRSIAPGTYNIWAVSEGATVEAIESFVVEAGKQYDDIDIHLVEGGWIEGVVLDDRTGEPMRFEEADAADIAWYGPSRPTSGAACELTKIKDDGTFRMRVPSGTNRPYFRSLRWDAVSNRFYDDGVTVKEGETTRIEFRVTRR